ncbi:DEAD/DEAH box helicase [Macrococcus canis]|uniref:DEAD/DEAH box helicase n=1 Tax=Macrococcoides canis TaxID=1855823 RepID=UPI00207C43EF|nr:ATP-binding domain-containing protein [Macrococcus canis]MCO4097218.1 DEAD/DEAH box helicase [Macrococcus canis]
MLEIIIPSAEYNKDENAKKLINFLNDNQEELNLKYATIYYNYPLFKEVGESAYTSSLFVISPFHGIFMLDINEKDKREVEVIQIEKNLEDLDILYTHVLSKLIKIPSLLKKRSRNDLSIPINTILYLPNYEYQNNNFSSYVTDTFPKLKNIILNLEIDKIDDEIIKDVYSVIDGTRAIPKPLKRIEDDNEKGSRGSRVSELEQQIATFDQKQKIAALTIVDGPQRIRGMAGSGKTIILAMKAALIHLDNPDSHILYTFYTKSLYYQVKQLITRFYRMHEDKDPNWDNIHILHAWGGKNFPGVYYNACRDNGSRVMPFSEAKYESQRSNMNIFEYICKDLLDQNNGKIKSKYDYVLIDEGQDFPNTFYWLCRKLVRNDRIVWAYDELQNILDIELQETEKLFQNEYGDKGIDLVQLMENHPYQNNDIVLHKSYRNPLEVLMTAHAIGFGLYNDMILQMLENEEHWNDLGYKVLKGNCIEGEETIISRPKENSPSIISDYYRFNEMVNLTLYDDFETEVESVCLKIKECIEDNLLPEDILVISVDDRNSKIYFKKIEQILSNYSINTNNILNSYNGDNFIEKDKVTLSTVYRAKGNEAAQVFVIGVDSLLDQKDDIIARNKLFTAFTRTKAWLSISGIDFNKGNFIEKEIQLAMKDIPEFKFKFPDLEKLKTHRRELAKENADLNRKREKLLSSLEGMDLDSETAIKLLKGEL